MKEGKKKKVEKALAIEVYVPSALNSEQSFAVDVRCGIVVALERDHDLWAYKLTTSFSLAPALAAGHGEGDIFGDNSEASDGQEQSAQTWA